MAAVGGLIIVVLWPLLLPIAVLYFFHVAMPLIMPIVAVWNQAVLMALLLVRWVWKRSGTMGRGYIDGKTGWHRVILLVLKYGLVVLILWEALIAFLCGTYKLWWPQVLGILIK